MPRHALLAAVFLVSACDPCHGWDEVVLGDPDGLDDGELLPAIQEGIDTFVAWTTREETCVEEARLVEGLTSHGEDISGRYNGVKRRISINPERNVGTIPSTTIHEFCHALDHEDGWPSEDYAAELAPHTEGLNEVFYSSDDERTHEAFARICEAGPVLHPMWEQLEEVCGVELYDDGISAVHELAFGGSDWEPTESLGNFSASTESWALSVEDGIEGERWGGQLVAGAEGLFRLELAGTWKDEESYSVVPIIQRIDPDSAAVVEWLALDAHGARWDEHDNPDYGWHVLLGSSGDPVLYDKTSPGGAWRVLCDPLRLEAIDFPSLPEGTTFTGAEHEGALLLLVGFGSDSYLATGELGAGALVSIEIEDETLAEATPWAIAATGDGAAAVFDHGGAVELAGLSWLGELDWQVSVPCTGCTAHELWLQPDGRVRIRPHVHTMTGDGTKPFPLLYDPATDVFRTPTGSCTDSLYWLQSVPWRGDPWAAQRSWDGDEKGALTLYRLSFEDA